MKTQFTIDDTLELDNETLAEMKRQLILSDFFGTRIRIGRARHAPVIVAQNMLNPRVPIKTWNENTRVWM
jgi:hypothetical protein